MITKILVVDDDPQFRRVIRVSLAAHGFQVSEAADGFQALDQLHAKPVDVVLLDWRMPGMGGEATTHAIRATSDVPIIVLTASDPSKEAIGPDVNAVFRKPINIQALLSCIEAVPGDSQHKANGDHAGRFTILLADDEMAIRRLIAPILRDQGFIVLEAADGVEALSIADQHNGPIHLLLTDWSMPRLNGGELIRRLSRRRPDIAVLVMSGTMETGTLPDIAVLRKPFKVDDLVSAVNSVLVS